MKPESRIQAAIELLSDIEDSHLPADVIASGYLRARRYIGSKDRRYISEAVFAVVRNRLLLRHLGGETPRLAVMIYLVVFEELSKNDVDDLFSGQHYGPEPIDDREFKVIKELMVGGIDKLPAAIRYSIPEWAATRIDPAEYSALNENAPLDVRVNVLKATREEVLTILDGEPGKHSSWSIRLKRGTQLSETDLYKKGLIEVQDEGSQMIALLVDAKPGEAVLDMCAGAGGKTLAIGAMMQNKGRLVAADINDVRLDQLTVRAKRAGLTNVEKRYTGSKDKKWLKRQQGHFDKVLIDVPCTGTGTWRRNPDLKWRFNEEALQELVQKQREIMEVAAKLVKPGGRLIYSTCSLLADENEAQAEYFLAQHPEFVEVEKLKLTPHKDGTDGFFGVVLERSGDRHCFASLAMTSDSCPIDFNTN